MRRQTRVNYYTAPATGFKKTALCTNSRIWRSFPNEETLICTLQAEGPGCATFRPRLAVRNPGRRWRASGAALGRSQAQAPPRSSYAVVLLRWSPALSSTAKRPLGFRVSSGSPDHREVGCLWRVGLSVTRSATAPAEDPEGCHSGCFSEVLA